MTGLFSHAPAPTVAECPTCGWDQTPTRNQRIAAHNQRRVRIDNGGRPYTYSSPDPCPGTGQPAATN